MLAVGSAALAFAIPASAQLGAPQPGTGTFGPVPLAGASGRTSYDHHWTPMHGDPTGFWPGKALWDAVAGPNNFGGPGDAIRICYGIDVTQGGRNWSGPGSTTPGPNGKAGDLHAGGGQTENTWFRIVQGFAPIALSTPQAGVDLGLISVQGGTSSDIAGDNCFTPFNKGTSNSGGHKVGAAAIGGLFSGTGVAAAPGIFWEFSFNWGPTPALVANKVGDDSLDPGIPGATPVVPPRGLGNPLLSNVIFEVQGPLNGPALGFLGNQYYLSSTIEWAGIKRLDNNGVTGFRGTGGVTNGNANWGFGIFGTDAGSSNAISATRFIGTGPTGAFISQNFRILTPLVQAGQNFRSGRIEFMGSLAFQTPRSWAYHNLNGGIGSGVNFSAAGPGHDPPGTPTFGSPVSLEGRDGGNGFMLATGNGGPDWRISGAPVSNVDLIAIDHESGADVAYNVYNKVGTYSTPNPTTPSFAGTPAGPYAHAAAGFDTTKGTGGYYFGIPGIPCIFQNLNRMLMLWSVTPCGAPMIQVPGSWDNMGSFIGIEGTAGLSIFTTREGYQTSSINFDGTTILLSGKSILLFGTRFSQSDDFFADGALDYGGNIFPSFSATFQGGFVPMSSGQSDMKPNGGQIPVAIPSPGLMGVPIYISMSGSHIDICNASAFETTEQYNALTIVLQ
jgi:hypothetical protein